MSARTAFCHALVILEVQNHRVTFVPHRHISDCLYYTHSTAFPMLKCFITILPFWAQVMLKKISREWPSEIMVKQK